PTVAEPGTPKPTRAGAAVLDTPLQVSGQAQSGRWASGTSTPFGTAIVLNAASPSARRAASAHLTVPPWQTARAGSGPARIAASAPSTRAACSPIDSPPGKRNAAPPARQAAHS